MTAETSNHALRNATITGTVLQLAMVISGHWVELTKMNVFAWGGVLISVLAGVLYARRARLPGSTRGNRRRTPPMRRVLLTSFALAIMAVRSPAQSAPTAPATTVADFSWLAGTWEGHIPGSTVVAEVTYSTPKAGLITGMMRLTNEGKVLMVEMIAMTDTPAGPELRFRHFSQRLDALEADFKQNMALVKHTPARDEFENRVAFSKELPSTQARNAMYIRHGADEYVAHSDVLDSNGKPDVVELTYRRK